MTYRDLPIHQRITAKGNRVSFSPKTEKLRGDLLKRMASTSIDTAAYTPEYPFYAIQFKTNTFDLSYNYNPHA